MELARLYPAVDRAGADTLNRRSFFWGNHLSFAKTLLTPNRIETRRFPKNDKTARLVCDFRPLPTFQTGFSHHELSVVPDQKLP